MTTRNQTDQPIARDASARSDCQPGAWAQRYSAIRARTESLCAPLATEDYVVQSMTDASPVGWHLAHSTWFFEQFVLTQGRANYQPHHPRYGYLFNSYYEGAGRRHPRPHRGLLTRPTVKEIYAYRRAVDESMAQFLSACLPDDPLLAVVEIGLHHEQQHQELILTDVKHLLSLNPLRPAYRTTGLSTASSDPGPLSWQEHTAGTYEIGHAGDGFAYDNERPRHRVFLEDFQIAHRLTTCGEYLCFIEDGGYRRPELWLSDGWRIAGERQWTAPLYWEQIDRQWQLFTLSGMRPVHLAEPVCHISYFEADAFARWSGARLPTEAEWEVAAVASLAADDLAGGGNFAENGHFHPLPASAGDEPQQWFGEAWQWTASPYIAYPGFRPLEGTLGEYNGKFMCGQVILRGGSRATPRSHMRPTYRNFFPSDARWQFSTLRLARDGSPS